MSRDMPTLLLIIDTKELLMKQYRKIVETLNTEIGHTLMQDPKIKLIIYYKQGCLIGVTAEMYDLVKDERPNCSYAICIQWGNITQRNIYWEYTTHSAAITEMKTYDYLFSRRLQIYYGVLRFKKEMEKTPIKKHLRNQVTYFLFGDIAYYVGYD